MLNRFRDWLLGADVVVKLFDGLYVGRHKKGVLEKIFNISIKR